MIRQLISLLLFLAVPAGVFAQGTLQFNQVRFIKQSDGPQTVPASKVWKLESVVPYQDSAPYSISTSGSNTGAFAPCGINSTYVYYYTSCIVINGVLVPFGKTGNSGDATHLPLWLPAGTSLCMISSSSFSALAYSVVEFNIIP